MTASVQYLDQCMASLWQIIAQGRKRIGLLVGAGAPVGILGISGHRDRSFQRNVTGDFIKA